MAEINVTADTGRPTGSRAAGRLRAEGKVPAVVYGLGKEPVHLRTLGGTVPIAPFIEALGFPAVLVPTVNFDNNQHEENENLRLGNLFDGILTVAAILRM